MPIDNVAYDDSLDEDEVPLVDQIGKVFPNASAEDISKEIDRLKTDHPDATDQDVLKVAESKAAPQQNFQDVLKDTTAEVPTPAAQESPYAPAPQPPSAETFTPQPQITPGTNIPSVQGQTGQPTVYQQAMQSYVQRYGTPEDHPIRNFLAASSRGLPGNIARGLQANETAKREQAYKNALLAKYAEEFQHKRELEKSRAGNLDVRQQELILNLSKFSEEHPQEAHDPNGRMSNTARPMLQSMLIDAGKPELAKSLEGVPLYEMTKIVKGIGAGEMYKQSQMNKRAYISAANRVPVEDKKEKDFRAEVSKMSDRIVKDPVIKKMQEQGISLDSVGQLADFSRSGNSIAGNALGAKMARAMGEVGVLTDQDVKRYTTSGKLGRKAADTLSKWLSGTPTEATLQEIQQIANVISDNYNTKIQSKTNRYIREFAKTHRMTPVEASDWLQHPYKEEARIYRSAKEIPDGETGLVNGVLFEHNGNEWNKVQ